MLDRWSVSVVNTGKGSFLKTQKDRQLIMNNYLGIGVDGQVALDFHQVHFVRLFVCICFMSAKYIPLLCFPSMYLFCVSRVCTSFVSRVYSPYCVYIPLLCLEYIPLWCLPGIYLSCLSATVGRALRILSAGYSLRLSTTGHAFVSAGRLL